MLDRLLAGGIDGADVHAVHLLAGNAEGHAAFGVVGLGRAATWRRAHGVAVVLDDVDHRQLPDRRHVEALRDLTLVGRTLPKIGQADVAVLAVMVDKRDAGPQHPLRANIPVTAVEMLLPGEHVHGAALALRQAAAASREFGHDALRIHAAGEHVAVIAVPRDHLIAFLRAHLHADHDG